MIIDILCFIIFLFTIFQLSKDDFIFIRKNVTLESIFNTVFLGLPLVLFSARLFYVILHPSLRYLNPLIFFIVPYFPGLSIIGGIIGAWIWTVIMSERKKAPSKRILDVFGISFLLTFSIGILLQGLSLLFTKRLSAGEEIGRATIGIACFLYAYMQFIKGTWNEGAIAYMSLCFYGLLALISVGFMALGRQHIALAPLIVTVLFLLGSLALFIRSFMQKK